MSSSLGFDTDDYGAATSKFRDVKADSMVKGTLDAKKKAQKGKVKALIETQFLTMSRLVNKIDPSGTLYEWVFGKNGVDKLVALEQERELDRYNAANVFCQSRN
jgi:hypothetical protein